MNREELQEELRFLYGLWYRYFNLYDLPEISRFISIDKDNYFKYVTSTENVLYYKVILIQEFMQL